MTMEAVALPQPLAGREVPQHEGEADEEDHELDRGKDALDQRPGRLVTPAPLVCGVERSRCGERPTLSATGSPFVHCAIPPSAACFVPSAR